MLAFICVAYKFCFSFELFFQVHKYLQAHDDESDLTGRVKELGKMFEGGGPVFPTTSKNDTDSGSYSH